MPLVAQQRPEISAGATRIVSFDFTDDLDSGTTLTGTPTIAEVTTTDLTITNKAVNTGTVEINGRTVAIGKALQCLISGQVSGTTYRIRFTCATTSTPAQTLVWDALVKCV